MDTSYPHLVALYQHPPATRGLLERAVIEHPSMALAEKEQAAADLANWHDAAQEHTILMRELHTTIDELNAARDRLQQLAAHFSWAAVQADTDPRHVFDGRGTCIRCGEDAEEWEAECVEGWTQRLTDGATTLRTLLGTVAAWYITALDVIDKSGTSPARVQLNELMLQAAELKL